MKSALSNECLVIEAVIVLQIMKTIWRLYHFLIFWECVCCCCTLVGFPVGAPDLSSSVTILSIGNFCTTGTNVKIEDVDGTPIETCKNRERRGTNHPYVTSSG